MDNSEQTPTIAEKCIILTVMGICILAAGVLKVGMIAGRRRTD